MTAHRTTPDETGARVVVLTSHERPGEVVIGAGSGAVFVTLAERVPLAQAVAGDEYAVIKRADYAALVARATYDPSRFDGGDLGAALRDELSSQ